MAVEPNRLPKEMSGQFFAGSCSTQFHEGFRIQARCKDRLLSGGRGDLQPMALDVGIVPDVPTMERLDVIPSDRVNGSLT